MATRNLKNIGASVRARLLNLARAENKSFHTVLLRYLQEWFLYRLSVSPHCRHFILKGALLFLAYDASSSRPTKNIDFLGRQTSSDLEHIHAMVQQIALIEAEDGVTFIPESVTVETIKEFEECTGVRVKIEARLRIYLSSSRRSLRGNRTNSSSGPPFSVETTFNPLSRLLRP